MTFFFIFLLVGFVLSLLLLVYIYIGYPLIILGLAKFYARPVKKEAIFPRVTIVIPAHNEEVVIGEKLDNVLELDYPSDFLQILVCDDASEDRTKDIVRTYLNRVELFEGVTRSGKVGVLNRAMQIATGEILVISDADTLTDRQALKELVANFADKSVGCAVAQTIMMKSDSETVESGGLYWRYEALIRQSESKLHSSVAATGHMMGLRCDILHPIPADVILDDFYLALMTMQQGLRVIFEPKAIVWERPTRSMEDEVIRRSRMTAGRFQVISMTKNYLSKLPFLLRFEIISHKFLRLAIPLLMALALILNILLTFSAYNLTTLVSPAWKMAITIALLLQGCFYSLAILGGLLPQNKGKKSKIMKVLMLPYFLCATNFASIIGLMAHFTGGRTVLWQQARRQ